MLFISCNVTPFGTRLVVLACIVLMLWTLPAAAQYGTAGNSAAGNSARGAIVQESKNEPANKTKESGVYFKVHFDAANKFSALKPGAIMEGVLADAVYSGAVELFPAGSRVRLTVDSLERTRRHANDHWPWVIKAFSPRHENRPVFSSASVSLPNRQEVPLKVSLISISDKRDVVVHWRADKGAASKGTGGSSTTAPQAPPPTRAAGRSARPTGTT